MALTISTRANSQTLTKHVPFASVFPLLKWKQVMRLSFFSSCTYSSEFSPPNCYQLSSARTYSLLRNDPPSRNPSIRLSPLGLYLFYLVRVCVKEITRLPSVISTFYSIHPDPNHVDEPCRSYPFRAFLQNMLLAKVSPFSRRVTLHRRHLWFTAFRAGLCLQTLQILPRGRHPVSPPPFGRVGLLLRLRHFKG